MNSDPPVTVMRKHRIFVVDDHPLFRQGVLFTLGRQPDISVVGEGENGRQAIEMAQLLHPEVMLLDITMPEIDGLHAADHNDDAFG